MEIVIFIAMLIVPVVSIAAFFLSFIAVKKIAALKKLVLSMAQSQPASQANVNAFQVEEI